MTQNNKDFGSISSKTRTALHEDAQIEVANDTTEERRIGRLPNAAETHNDRVGVKKF